MKSVLVVDDMAVFREPIAASLRLAGYETQCAADGQEALRLTRAHHPDVIVLDVTMPNMDGITFLRHLRCDPAIAHTHVILLTVVSEKNQILAAGSLGVKDYVLKSRFRLDDLLERIKKFDSSAPPKTKCEESPAAPAAPKPKAGATGAAKETVEVSRLMSRDQFLDRVKQVFQAKTLSGVVVEVIAMASSPKGDTAQLATLIARDPMLSARVLQAANSAMYASAGAVVTTIRDAIRKVGYTAVRNIAAALGVFGCMPEAGTDGFNPIRCWQHSFAVAQLCEKLASEKLAEQTGLAYLVGLCHDLGDIFIRTEFGKEYQQVVEMSAKTGKPKDLLHGQMLGMTPAQMISAVLKCMSLPDAIREPIEMLHSPGLETSTQPLARILWMAENYANAALLASSPSSEVAPLTQTFCRASVGHPNPPRPDPQTLRSNVLSLTVALARLSHADEKKLLAPMFKTQTAKIWIARDAGISEFDPVALALESLTKVVVEKRLPTEKETEDLGGLVVVASAIDNAGYTKRDIELLVDKVRNSGRMLPVLAVSCGADHVETQSEEISWRASIALSEFATLTEKPAKTAPAQAA
jgi:HD-like signal output (HDOD) protein/CheY-like chemotaxis protein